MVSDRFHCTYAYAPGVALGPAGFDALAGDYTLMLSRIPLRNLIRCSSHPELDHQCHIEKLLLQIGYYTEMKARL